MTHDNSTTNLPPGLSHLTPKLAGQQADEKSSFHPARFSLPLIKPLDPSSLHALSAASHQGQVLRGVLLAGSVLILVYCDIEYPVQAVSMPQWARPLAPFISGPPFIAIPMAPAGARAECASPPRPASSDLKRGPPSSASRSATAR